MPGPDQTSSTQPHKALPKLEDLLANFEVIEDWEERYRYLIEIGRDLPPMPEADKTEANRVRGCASQVWLTRQIGHDATGAATLTYAGESDAHIVRGLVALTLAIFSGKTAQAILATDPFPVFDALGLSQHLTPQRSNGVRSMVERIRNDARGAV
jgi:cysteine desulfuration protein SufE